MSAEIVDRSTGQRISVPTTPLAFDGGYKIGCALLPRKRTLKFTMAIARPTGQKGFAINFADGFHYWLRADIDGVARIGDYFAAKRVARWIQIDGDFRVDGVKTSLSRRIDVIDVVGEAMRKGLKP